MLSIRLKGLFGCDKAFGAAPVPVPATMIVTPPSAASVLIITSPPSRMKFTAFAKRLRSIHLTLRLSAYVGGMVSGNDMPVLIFTTEVR